MNEYEYNLGDKDSEIQGEKPKDETSHIENPEQGKIAEIDAEEQIIKIIEWIVSGINHSNYNKDHEILFDENAGATATAIFHIHTTERAVGYLFYGIGDHEELKNILQSMQTIGAKGTFFVTYDEIVNNPVDIKLIVDEGHALGVAVIPNDSKDFFAACYEITRTISILDEEYGYSNVKMVIQPWNQADDHVLEAISALNLKYLVWETTMMKKETAEAGDAKAIIEIVFGPNQYELKRGQQVFFRMNYIHKDPHILSNLILEMEKERNIYSIKPVQEILENEKYMYTYPLPENLILPEVKDKIYPGQLNGDIFENIKNKYIGYKHTSTYKKLPGFTEGEIKQLDKVGTIKNNERAVFLTFDDWGTDRSITKLLDVLAKYNIKVTFYILTEHVESNPNLLRAIAEEGHDISTHSHTHYVIADGPDENGVFSNLSEEHLKGLEEDIIKSYQILQSIVGDLRNDEGRPILSRTFRPPTMAVSKNGMKTVLDCGYTYVINGYFTSQDYEAPSEIELYQKTKPDLVPGAVAIFHSSADSKYTAEVLDRIFSENAKLPEKSRLTFRRISDYLN